MAEKTGKVRPLTEADLEQVRAWRNHPDVRRFMYTQHEITQAEHRQWFATASADPSRDLLVYENEEGPCGFVQFTLKSHGHIADWGFYLAPAAPPGSGRDLGLAALDHAFTQRHLHKLCGEALGFNVKSVRFHEGLGFTREGILRDQHFDGQHYHDIYCFGLLATEWCDLKT